MNYINAKQLKSFMDEGFEFKLINALEEHKFRAKHIPGSLNFHTKEDIKKNLSKDDLIIVYCTDAACNKSIIFYHFLESMGFEKIFRFAGEMCEWEEKCYPVEGESLTA